MAGTALVGTCRTCCGLDPSPEKTKPFQLTLSDKQLAMKLAESCDDNKDDRLARKVKKSVGVSSSTDDGNTAMIVSNDLKALTHQRASCQKFYPPDKENWALYWITRFKHEALGKNVPASDHPICVACASSRKKPQVVTGA